MMGALWLFVIGLPLVLALLMALRTPMRPVALALMPWSAMPALITSLWPDFGGFTTLPWLLLGAEFGLDTIGRIFLFFTALLWTIAGVYARTYMAHDRSPERFFIFFLLTMSGNLGLIVAQDIASFYFLFSLMSLSAYGLIVHEGDQRSRRAGRIYLIMAVAGEGMLLAAFVLVASAAGNLSLAEAPIAVAESPNRDIIIALLLVGFGIKAGALPFHVWLPLAHPVAPTPASAVLSGCMIKTGLIGWLRCLPLGEAELTGWGTIWITMGLVSTFFGVAIGLTQINPKTVLAYSSISQMGIINIGVGVGLAAPQTWPLPLVAGLIYALHHGLAKGSLFLGVGVATSRWTTSLGRGLVIAGLTLPALALAGLPATSGFLAKTVLKDVSHGAPDPWLDLLDLLLPIAAVVTTLLMARFLVLVQPTASGDHGPERGIWLPWAVLLVGVGVAAWVLPGYYNLDVIGPGLFTAGNLLASIWPVILGVTAAVIAWEASRRKHLRTVPVIPPGDLLVLVEWAGRRSGQPLPDEPVPPAPVDPVVSLGSRWYGLFTESHERNALEQLEARLTYWGTAGVLFLLLLAVLFALLLYA